MYKEFCLIPYGKTFIRPEMFLNRGRGLEYHTLLLLGDYELRDLDAIDAMLQACLEAFENPLRYVFHNRHEIGDPSCALPGVGDQRRKLIADIVSGEYGTSMWRFEVVRDGFAVGELYGIQRDDDPMPEERLRVVPGTDLEFARADFAELHYLTIELATSEEGDSYTWLWPVEPELFYRFYEWLKASGVSWPYNLHPIA